ncbi:uncharacterized protein LOC132760434 [Ruditapes philippinarum]|uniref:uncharacterized protein LOC132760434 n=1 Tax=Ruditapes philippinarum TaxID=129788 RepID=UPI00295B26E3|nr:uncharacterized protein LOC132760434 [Ruditapes philippinarum]
MEQFLKASNKTSQLLAGNVAADGSLKDDDVRNDLCSQYKLTTLLAISGYTMEAHILLDRIKKNFMQANGDFISYPEKNEIGRKSSSFPMTHFWSYMNAWIAMGAQRLGRFDISFPAFEFCKTFFNPDYNLACVTEAFDEANGDSTMDTLSTAHFGLLSLYMGDLEKAKLCGEGLLNLKAVQPNLENELLLRMSVKTGALIANPPKNMEPFFVVKRDSPNQLYFFLGYHGIFMTKLYQVTKDQIFLDSAKAMINFALACHESIYTFSFSHKVAYASALLAVETKEEKYCTLALKIGEYLISMISEDGYFCKEMEPIDKYDQSTEIAIWLREINNELQKN